MDDNEMVDEVTSLYRCRKCDVSYETDVQLRFHLRTHSNHRNNSELRCNKCRRNFVSVETMRKHMKMHTTGRPFRCEHCNKRFTSMNTLREHNRVHTGEKPFQCSQCNHGFSTNSNLVRHMRVHTGERPYACTRCDRSFNQSTLLRNHMENFCFRGFVCRICKKRCGDFFNLREHMKDEHLDEKFKQTKKNLYEDLDRFVNFGFRDKKFSHKNDDDASHQPVRNRENLRYTLRVRDATKVAKIKDTSDEDLMDSDLEEEIIIASPIEIKPSENQENLDFLVPDDSGDMYSEDELEEDSDLETLSIEADDEDEIYEMGILTSIRVVGETDPITVAIIPEHSDSETQEQDDVSSTQCEAGSQMWKIIESEVVMENADK